MSGKTKLELTWIGKDNRPRLEPRILLEDPDKSYHAAQRVSEDDIFDNRLIFGDNLLALKALEQEFTGRVKCVYIDPPFNTGQAFPEYDDGIEHSLWLDLMYQRLRLLHSLLCHEGSLFVEIDDTQSSYLQVILDEVFGRRNRIQTVTIKRSAPTGHKSINPGPMNVVDYLHIYAKDKSKWKYKPQYVAREDYDDAYDVRLINPGDHFSTWKFEKLGEQVARTNGFETAKEAKKALGKKKFESMFIEYAMQHPDEVVRFAQPNYSGVSKAARELIDLSKNNDGVIVRLERENYSDMYFMRGNRILFLLDKVDDGEEGEGPALVEPLTNFWADIPWQGIAREGGVDFPKNKKPERLVKRILDMATEPGDLVLDSFAGSGTTGAVAHKMRRRWIMVELGDHCHSLILPRLKKVIDGEDASGVTNTTSWKGGGGFRYYTLAPSLLEKDSFGNLIVSKKYNPAMLAEALCKLEGFTYSPSETEFWQHGHSTESDYLYVTTQTLSRDQLADLSERVGDKRTLLVLCTAFRAKGLDEFPNLTVKKIPKTIQHRCEWGKDDYSLEIRNLPAASREPDPAPQAAVNGSPRSRRTRTSDMPLFGGDDQ